MRSILITCFLLTVSCIKTQEEKKCQITVAMPSDPASLHPGKGADPYSCIVHFALFEGLTRFAKNKPYELAIAKKIEVSQDKTRFVFHLKESFWSNKQPLTAYDFYESWSRILDPDFPAPNAHLFYPIKNAREVKCRLLPKTALGIRAIDKNTFEVILKRPTPYFLNLISFCSFSPHFHKSQKHDQGPFVSNGPFILESHKIRNHLILKKNPLYHDAKNVDLQSIKISIINDENTALNLFRKGKLDILGAGFTSLPQESLNTLSEENILQSHSIAATSFYTFNTLRAPFNNKKLRKALILSINRKSLVQNIVGREGTIANNITPNTILKATEPSECLFNITLAKKYLKEALNETHLTIKDLSSIRMYYHSKCIEKRVALFLQQQWKKNLGLDIQIEACEFKVLMDRITTKNYTMALCSLITQFDDPIAVLERFKHKENVKNYSGFESEKFKNLIEKSETLNGEDRLNTLLEAQKIVMHDFVMDPLYHFNFLYATSDRISNLFLSKIGSAHLNHICIKESKKN